mgnify:CR=1 FL=1
MIGFGIGINSVISFYMGAQDKAQADKAASQGILLATIHGIVMTAGCIMLIKPFLCMFTNDSSIVELGLQYLIYSICIFNNTWMGVSWRKSI